MENRRSVPGNDMVDRGRGCWTIDISASFIPEVAVSYDSKATLSDGWSEGVCVCIVNIGIPSEIRSGRGIIDAVARKGNRI